MVKEVLNLCKILNILMVVDVYYYNCNNNGELIQDMLEEIFNIWNREELLFKIYFLILRDYEKDRKYLDYINVIDFIEFIEKVKKIDRDFDVMLECKKKDEVLYRLVEDIKNIKLWYKWID